MDIEQVDIEQMIIDKVKKPKTKMTDARKRSNDKYYKNNFEKFKELKAKLYLKNKQDPVYNEKRKIAQKAYHERLKIKKQQQKEANNVD